MLFNSVEFAIFLPLVFLLYWFIVHKKTLHQNLLLVAASYFFYGWWDYRFLALIIFSSIVDFSIGKLIPNQKRQSKKKLLLLLSIIVNIGFLSVFKYYNFFIESFVNAFSAFGNEFNASRLSIILPVGISFYTFQTLSYTIDVYRGKLKPTNDVISFLAFVSFFPQLVAGPIERASNLLPQFYKKRTFSYEKGSDGMRQILWGFFKKVVIADNCAPYVNDIFTNYSSYSGSTLALGAVFFAFQIYCDFSGYSDIAIGTARLFGFNLMQNFAFPYFSRDIAEFWRRWHISLSTWFRDYIYIPIGGSRVSKPRVVFNIFVLFLISGLWHGANWTFVAWGAINALYFVPLFVFEKNRKNRNTVAENKHLPSIKEFVQLIVTFSITCIAWIFFRANSIEHAWEYINAMFSKSLFSRPFIYSIKSYVLAIIFLFFIEWLNRNKHYGGDVLHLKPFRRRVFYALVILFIFFQGNFDVNQFIYFQF